MSMYMNGRYFKITHPPRSFFVEGNPVVFKTKYKLPIKSLKVNFEPVQDLHGYEKPWPAGGGKNLFDVSQIPSFSLSTGGEIVNNGDGSITITTPSGSGGIYCRKTLAELAPGLVAGETYTLSLDSTGSSKYIYLIPANEGWTVGAGAKTVTQAMLDSGVYFYASGVSTTATISNIQIEKGSTATTWAPYSNVCPITGWTGANVTHSGADVSDSTTTHFSWTSDAGTVYGGYLEWLRDGTVKLTADRVKKTLTSFTGAFEATPNGYAVYAYIPNGSRTKTIRKIRMCNMFFDSTLSYTSMPLYSYMGGSGANTTWTFILPSTVTTLQEANAWLAALSEPIEFTYALATPQTYTLTPQEALTLLQGTNTIWSDTNGNLEVTYESYTNEQ